MTGMIWSEEELSNAANRVVESMLSSFGECEHEFSEKFEQDMASLQKKIRRMSAVHKVWQRVAAIFIVAILSLSTWLTVDVEARERAFQWVKEIYESMTVYLFSSEDSENDSVSYEPTWIPEGFALVDNFRDSEYCLRVYSNETGEKMFAIEYTLMRHTSMSITAQDYSEVINVDVNGIPADLYVGNEASPQGALVWVDEANQIVFNIQGNISNEDIVHIAQSLILSIPTK